MVKSINTAPQAMHISLFHLSVGFYAYTLTASAILWVFVSEFSGHGWRSGLELSLPSGSGQ